MSFNTFYLNSENSSGIIDGSNVVIGGRLGISIDPPQHTLDVSGTTRSTNLLATTATIDNLDISGETVDITSLQTKVENTQMVSFTVIVASKTSNAANSGGSSSDYVINNVETPYLHFTAGKTYRFDQSDSTNSTHPILFYLDENKTSQYSSGVTTVGSAGTSGAYVEISITSNTPETIYYQCQNHAYMGGKIYVKGSNVTAITSVGTLTAGTWNASTIQKQYINTSSISVNDLSDVSFNSTSTTDGQALVWNATDAVWEAGVVAGSGGGLADLSASSITDLSDVSFNTSSITNGQTLVWNASDAVWEAGTIETNTTNTTTLISNNHGDFKLLEKITGVCDGRTISGESTAYTLQQVSNYQDISTILVDVNGSSISYTPPNNTNQVLYNFKFNVVDLSGDATVFNQNHTLTLTLHLFIDDVEIENQRAQISNYIYNNGHYFTYSAIIDIGSVETDDVANGKYASWTSSKVIKLKAANSHYDYPVQLFSIKTESLGTFVSTFVPPTIEVASIGNVDNISFSTVSANDLSDISFNTTYTNNGQALLWDSTNGVWTPGSVATNSIISNVMSNNYGNFKPLEKIAGVCDGRTITGDPNTYTLKQVTTYQDISTTLVDVNGSSIAYTPPYNATQVLYNFKFNVVDLSGDATVFNQNYTLTLTLHLYIDGVEITNQKAQISNYMFNNGHYFTYSAVIDIGSVEFDDIENGKYAVWNTSKVIKLKAANSHYDYPVRLFSIKTVSLGSYVHTFVPPIIEVASIGDISNISFASVSIGDLSDVSFNSTTTTDGQTLVWNSTDAVWETGTVVGSGGGGGGIADLSDVSFNSATTANYQPLTWNTTNQTWEPSTTMSIDTIQEKTTNNGVIVENVTLNNGSVTVPSDISAHHVYGVNYHVGSKTIVSASAQANFNDLEVKNSTTNTTTLLVLGQSEVMELSGTFKTDIIEEKTNNNGVIIEGVTIKNNSITAGSNGSISATNFNIGSRNIVSAAAQANFTDLEVKNSITNTTTLLVLGQSGVMELSGTLKTDIIEEKTANNGVDIEGVLLKDADISANDVSFNNIHVLGDISFNGNLYQNGTLFQSGSGGGGGGGLTDLSATSINDLSDVSLNGIQVNQTLKWDGSNLVPTTLATTSTKQGQVLEIIKSRCDGSTVTVSSGSYTMPVQTFSNGYTLPTTMTADPASLINYKAPIGTDRIIFKYRPSMSFKDARPIIFYQLAINNTLIDSTYTKYNAGDQGIGSYEFEVVITNSMVTDITSTNKYQFHARSLNTSNEVQYQSQTFTNNSDDIFISQDFIEIIAIGESSGQSVTLTNNSVNDLSDISFNSTTTTDGQALVWNSTDAVWEAGSVASSGGVSSGDDISFNNLDISGVLATNKSNNEIKLGAHIIPTTNSTYDLGSAEYKIRHLFLSSNSLWVGDDHKIDISGGKMRFKKRKKASVPTSIANAGGTDSGALAFAGVAQLADIQLHQWEAYAHTLGGLEAATIADIFQTELSNDWEEDFEAGKDTNPTITNIAYSSETVRTAALSTDWNSAVIPWKTSTLKRLYYNDANVGINKTYASYTLDVGGSIASSTGLVSGSDDRIKHNEQPITNALSTISKLTPKHYFKTGTKMYDASHNFVVDTLGTPLDESGNPLKFKEEYTIETGIIAQEIRTIPELQFAVYGEEYVEETVTTYKKDNSGNDVLDDSGNKIVESVETKQKPNTLAVDYNSIHCTHIAATKELHQLVESQQTTIEEQQNEIEHLKLVNQDINTQLNTALTELETIKQYLGI